MLKFITALILILMGGICIAEEQHYVVLPKKFEKSKIIIVDTPEYKKLLLENKGLQDQINKEKQSLDSFKWEVDEILRQKDKAYNDLIKELEKEKIKSTKLGLLSKLFGFTSIIIPVLSVGLVVLCFLNPSIVFAVFGFINMILDIIARWLNAITKFFKKSSG